MGQSKSKSKNYMTFTNCVDAVEKYVEDNPNFFVDLRNIEEVRMLCLKLAPSGFSDENRYLRNWQLAELCDVTEQEMSHFRHSVKISTKKQKRISLQIQEVCYAKMRRVAVRNCPKAPYRYIEEMLQDAINNREIYIKQLNV